MGGARLSPSNQHSVAHDTRARVKVDLKRRQTFAAIPFLG
jgi:hypothetical protein